MEKKTTQRIIGILVAMALLVVLMPLVFSKNDLAQTAAIKAPPFPDQQQPEGVNPSNDNTANATVITQEMADKVNGMSVSAVSPDTQSQDSAPSPVPVLDSNPTTAATAQEPATNSPNDSATQPTVSQLPEQNTQPQEQALSQSTVNNTANVDNATNQNDVNTTDVQSKDPSSPLSTNQVEPGVNSPLPATTSASATDKNTTKEESSTNPYSTISSDQNFQDTPVITRDNAPTSLHPSSTSAKSHLVRMTERDHSGSHKTFTHSKQSGWIIQMGSFKDKDNARRLANRLRTSGYKAFMREVKSPHGSLQTRVYIGPEQQQATATKLTAKLQQDMKLHGFVIAYKPFEL